MLADLLAVDSQDIDLGRVLGARRATTHLHRYTLIYNQSTKAVSSCQVELQGQRTGWSLDLHLPETSTRSTNLLPEHLEYQPLSIRETILVQKSTMPFHLCSITIPQPLRPIASFHTTMFSIPRNQLPSHVWMIRKLEVVQGCKG